MSVVDKVAIVADDHMACSCPALLDMTRGAHVARVLANAGLLAATDDGGSLAMQRATFPNSLPPTRRQS